MADKSQVASDERTQFENAYLTFGTRADEPVALMRDVNNEYVCNETKDSWNTWQFARGVFEKSDAYEDWVNEVAVHVNECDATLVSLEGHYQFYDYKLKDCASAEEGWALKKQLDAFLYSQPEKRASLAEVTAELAKLSGLAVKV